MDFVKITLWDNGKLTIEPEESNYGYNNDVFYHSTPKKSGSFVVYHKDKVEQGKKKLFNYLEKEIKIKVKPLEIQLKLIEKWKNSNK